MAVKRGWVWSVSILVVVVGVVLLLHAVHVLPLPPVAPYKNGEGVMVTPSNVWHWWK